MKFSTPCALDGLPTPRRERSARVKDEQARQSLLEEAITFDLSLTQIKERIKSIAESSADDNNSQPLALKNQMDSAYHLAKKSKIWDNPKKQRQLEKLLAQLERLVSRE